MGRRWLSRWKSPSISILETPSTGLDLMRVEKEWQYASRTYAQTHVKGTHDEKED